MNTEETTRPGTSSFLPDINPNSNRECSNSTQSGMKQEEEPYQTLTRTDVSQFRNSLKQNICMEMLREGFHRSFAEFFHLLILDQDQRAAAEPGTAAVSQTPLEDQPEKLETLRRHLTAAEKAERTGSWSTVCDQRLFLGGFFSAPEDQWLSFHFYHSCSDREQGGRSRPATEARARMAELYLQEGDLDQARRQAELCIQQAEDPGWLDSDGRPLRIRAIKTLWRVYSRLVDPLLYAEDYSEALELLLKGQNLATESEDKQIEGEVAYRLGLTYQGTGDHSKAKQFFNTCIQICGTLQDMDGLAKAYRGMARSLESEGNTEEMVQCLEKMADISISNNLQHHLVDAHLKLGMVYYKGSRHQTAYEYFLQGYDVAGNLGDVDLVQKAQLLVGISRAQILIRSFSRDIASATVGALRRLASWKETRGGYGEVAGEFTGNNDN